MRFTKPLPYGAQSKLAKDFKLSRQAVSKILFGLIKRPDVWKAALELAAKHAQRQRIADFRVYLLNLTDEQLYEFLKKT